MKKFIGTILSLTLLGIMAVPAAAQGRRYQDTRGRQENSRDNDFRRGDRDRDGDRDRRDNDRWRDNDDRYRNNRGVNIFSVIFGRNVHRNDRRY